MASAVHNNILGGLSGFHENYSLNKQLIEDTIISERLQIIKEYILKGIPLEKELYISINCVPIDCDTSLERCMCNAKSDCDTYVPHFEIPQLFEIGDSTIQYIGSTDRQLPFAQYSSMQSIKYKKYKKRNKNKPYVWIDRTPNKNGMYDGFIFNAPLLQEISITAIFKDPRQLKKYKCCVDDDQMSALDAEIVDRVTKKLITYYRQLHMPPHPNTQQYMPG